MKEEEEEDEPFNYVGIYIARDCGHLNHKSQWSYPDISKKPHKPATSCAKAQHVIPSLTETMVVAVSAEGVAPLVGP